MNLNTWVKISEEHITQILLLSLLLKFGVLKEPAINMSILAGMEGKIQVSINSIVSRASH